MAVFIGTVDIYCGVITKGYGRCVLAENTGCALDKWHFFHITANFNAFY